MPYALPEICLFLSALAVLAVAAFRGDRSLDLCSALGGGLLLLCAFLPAGGHGHAFGSGFVSDPLTLFARPVIYGVSALALALAPPALKHLGIDRAEYPALVLFAALGMMVMIAAGDFLTLYLGLELQSLVLYVLAAIRRDHGDASEAGLKYFVLGALASAFLLFGLSFLYGNAGSLAYADVGAALRGQGNGLLALVGCVFVIAGLGFKLAVAPFHLWAPDVYENAPTPVTAFFATAPKLAAFVLLGRLVLGPFAALQDRLLPLLILLAILTMGIGGVGGLLQSRVKRLMAYSSIANMGALLAGLATGSVEGFSAGLTYVCFYFAATIGVFAVLLSLKSGDRMSDAVPDLAGLGRFHPRSAGLLAFFLFSLASVPPLPGFWGKYVLFLETVKAGLAPVAVFGVLASVASAAYYLRVVRVLFFEPSGMIPPREEKNVVLLLVQGLMAGLLLLAIFMPAPLFDAARAAVRHMGGS